MRKTRLFWLAAAAGCILTILVTSGCSAIGFGTGMAIDNSLLDTKNIDPWQCGSIKAGTRVIVHMKDGSIYEGSYGGLDTLSTEEYTGLFNEFLRIKPGDINCPGLGDTVRIVDDYGDEAFYQFQGVEYAHILTARRRRVGGGRPIRLLKARSIDKSKDLEFRLDDINTMIDCRGEVIEAKNLEHLVALGLIPVKTVMIVNVTAPKSQLVENGRQLISIGNIHTLEVAPGKRMKWVGLTLGAAVDAAVVAIAIAISSMPSWGTW